MQREETEMQSHGCRCAGGETPRCRAPKFSRQKFECITTQGDVHALGARISWQNFDGMFFATIGRQPSHRAKRGGPWGKYRRTSCEPVLCILHCSCEA